MTDSKDELIVRMGDELLRMSRQLSKVAEKKVEIPKVLDVVPPYTVHQAVTILLQAVGEDPTREGLVETPERFRKAWEEMLGGYKVDVEQLFKTFQTKADEMVVVKDIPFTSFCEHHLLPFTGVAHVGYIAETEIIGLSKVARIVLAYAKRLQVQEQLTNQVTEAFEKYMPKCLGSACVVEAAHTCMACRGVRVAGASMITSSMKGVFREQAEVRAEFLAFVRN